MTTTHDDVKALIDTIDDEAVLDGLREVLQQDPGALRMALEDLGFVDVEQTLGEPGEDDELSEAEADILEVMQHTGSPKTTDQIQTIIETEHPDVYEKYDSIEHQSWMNEKLNSLSKQGHIGKFRDGRDVLFAGDPKQAVEQWALRQNMYAEDLTVADAGEMQQDSNMPLESIREAIRSIHADA